MNCNTTREAALNPSDHDLLLRIDGRTLELVDAVKGSNTQPGLIQRTGSLERWRAYMTGAVAVLCGLWLASVTIGGVLLASVLQKQKP